MVNEAAYVIMRGSKYLTPSGSVNSFTDKLQEARTFSTREAAQEEACENERVAVR